MNDHIEEKMKILFIAHSSEIGGAEKSLIELIKGLIKRGIYCCVVVPGEGSLLNELKNLSIPTYVIFLPWCADGERQYEKSRISEIGKSVAELLGIARKIKPDVIYSNSSVILQGAIASWMMGIKHVWHIREFGELDYGINYYLSIEKRAEFVFKYSDKIIFISNALRDYYNKHIPKHKSEVVYNDVKIPKSADIKREDNNDKNLNLLMVGNVHPAKGQLDAIKAIKLLNDKGISNIKLRIVGRKMDGYYSKLTDFIRENRLFDKVEFFDFTPDPSDFFKGADILLMCSRFEGFGRVTVEAMLFGKPVIGVSSGGTMEIVKDGNNGLLYEAGNSDDLSKKIELLYNDREKIKEYGENGKIFCEDNFSEEKYVGRIMDILDEITPREENIILGEMLLEGICETGRVREKFNIAERELYLKKQELQGIYSSYEWKIASILKKVVDMFMPDGSLRRRFFIACLNFGVACLNLYLNIYRKIKGIILFSRDFFIKERSRKERKVNLQSKKIVFVHHSYHDKTLSNDFLLKYLRENFEVKLISDDSWNGKSHPDLSFIDDSYLGVIFWQILPPARIIKKIRNDNIIYFPMYDFSLKFGYDFWHGCRDLKIISLSKTLHEKLEKWGFETMYVQYFPETGEFIPGKRDEIFFWQRVTEIDINLMEKILGNQKVKLHMHKAIDPYNEYSEPSDEQDKKYEISYSEWFETREEMWSFADSKGIYVAPRRYEGIGLSFLEAMAKGKAVIAANNPTMNEYIRHGETGYLYDFKDPKKIDLSNIDEMQRNAYKYMRHGHEKWKKNRNKIIEFIKK